MKVADTFGKIFGFYKNNDHFHVVLVATEDGPR